MSNISNQNCVSGFSECSHFSYGTNRLFLETQSSLRERSSRCMRLLRGERTHDNLPECLCLVICNNTNSGKGWLLGQISEGRGSKEGNHTSAGWLCFSLFEVNWSVWRAYKQGSRVRGELNTLLSKHTWQAVALSAHMSETEQTGCNFLSPFKFMSFFVKRPKVLTTSPRGWNDQ